MSEPMCDDVGAFADGELSTEQAEAFRRHLATCAECQADLRDLMMVQATTDVHAAALRAEPATAPVAHRAPATTGERAPAQVISLAWYRRRSVQAAGAVTALAAAAAIALLVRGEAPVTLAMAPTRTLEARLGYAGADRFRPYDVLRDRAAPHEQVPAQALATLEKRGDTHGVAAGYLLEGEPARAAEYLARAPSDARAEIDRAVVALLEHRPAEALATLDAVLREQPTLAPALWDRALALRDLGRAPEAAAAFDRVAALGEPGWSEEARNRAQALRAPSLE
jgi:hypothetical protein